MPFRAHQLRFNLTDEPVTFVPAPALTERFLDLSQENARLSRFVELHRRHLRHLLHFIANTGYAQDIPQQQKATDALNAELEEAPHVWGARILAMRIRIREQHIRGGYQALIGGLRQAGDHLPDAHFKDADDEK